MTSTGAIRQEGFGPAGAAPAPKKESTLGWIRQHKEELALLRTVAIFMVIASMSHVVRPVIAGIMGVIFLRTTLKRPDLGVCMVMLYLVAPPLIETKSLLGIPGLNPDSVMMLILLWVARQRSLARMARLNAEGLPPRPRPNPLALPLLTFMGLVILSCAITPFSSGYEFFAALINAKAFLTFMLMIFVVVWGMETEQEKIAVFAGFLCTLAFLTGFGLRDTIVHFGSARFRLDTFFGQANEVGGFLAMYVVFVISALLAPSIAKKYKTLLIPLLFTTAVSLTFTLSRGSIIGAAAGFVVMGLIYSRKLLVIGLIAGCTYQIWMPERLIQRFLETTEDVDANSAYGLDGSTEVRLKQWGGVPEMVSDSPLLGHGFCSFPYIYRNRVSGKLKAAHSSWIEILVEQGILGLGAVMWLLAIVALLAWRVMKKGKGVLAETLGPGMLACVAVILAVNCVGDRLHNPIINAYFWALCGLLVLEHNKLTQGVALAAAPVTAGEGGPSQSVTGFFPASGGVAARAAAGLPATAAQGEVGLRSDSLAGFFPARAPASTGNPEGNGRDGARPDDHLARDPSLSSFLRPATRPPQ